MFCSRKRIFILCMATLILSPILFGLKLTYSEIYASTDVEKTLVPNEKQFPIFQPTVRLNDSSPSEPSTTLPPSAPPPTTQSQTSIVVSPQTINLTASDSVTVNINVINVTNLIGYDFELGYNSSIVTATEVSVGDFFPKDSFIIRKEIISTIWLEEEKTSIVWVAVCAPIGSDFKASGNGTLATVRFKAISTGSCVLKFYETELVNDYYKDTAHNVVDGYVQCKIYEHEVAAYLDAPIHLQPGSSWLLKASAVNKGIRNETDVSFQLLIDGVVNSTIASLLTIGSSIGLTYMFTPTEERIYNVTAYVQPVSNEERTQNNIASRNVVVRTQIKVPQDYATIQQAIDTAVSGETIVVASGVYREHIGIDKPLTLKGEDCNTTIIDGDGERKVIVMIKASEVRFSGFTIRNGGGGILLEYSNNSVITDNIITNTMDGLSLLFSHNNTIVSNTIEDNELGLFFGYSNSNTVYYNNFINNTEQADVMDSQNIWDNGAEGNYWSDYEGEDLNGDGIGDTPYVVDKDNRDNYPIVKQRLG